MVADVILAFVFTLLVSASARKDIEKCDDPFYEWTKYFDSDDPGHSGDFETLKHHLAYYPDDVCENPIGIDVRLLNGEHHTSAYEVTSISLTHGFACFNKHQRRNWGVSKCSDYKVRYCCPKKVVCEDVGREFTPFFDVSSGEGIDQMETVNNIRAISGLDFVVCDEPTAVDVRLVDGTALMTGGNVLEVTNLGLVCIESQQPAGKSCKDYKVRFCCPKRPPVPSTCGDGREWTEFFSIDQPFTSPSDPGDLELIADIRNQRRGELCRPEQITAIEVQLMNGVPAAESGDPTFTGLDFGFVCLNANQENRLCHDYKARFCCPEKIRIPTCSGESEWSKFLDRDDPTGRDDNELLPFQRLRKPELCEVSLAIDFRLAGGVRLDYYDDTFAQLSQQFGLLCQNRDQNDNRCDDYEVRFCCPKHLPEQECEGDGNQWTVWYNSDDPSESGDIECLQNLRADNPGEICENPSAINAEIASIEFPYYLTNEKVKISRNSGLTCLRSDQTDNSCVDYRVRFCCPKRNNNHWTEWVNRDSPSFSFDNERLKEILDGNFDVCTKPTSVEARLVATEEPYFTANEMVSISPSLGFICQNDLQVDGMCENYEVRFCCPDGKDYVVFTYFNPSRLPSYE
ncbi:hypothetical protein SNE40_005147 [Patella caerulea]|uniref:WxxW domain-containing protein n=1 Tax=Patella caerulea TaxID=87958 RepID=A0AAN8K4N6_PATCE